MAVYGFSQRSIAQRLKRLAQTPEGSVSGPTQGPHVPLIKRNHGSSWYVKLTKELIAWDETTELAGTADETEVYYIDLEGKFRQFQDDYGNNVTTTVYNVTGNSFQAEEFLPCIDLHGKPVVISSSGPLDRMRFKTIAKMADREVLVEITLVSSNQVNTSTGELYAIGDTINVYDPKNLFPDVETGATGWAYWSDQVGDVPSDQAPRWEIEQCTRPINEIEVTLDECLLANQFVCEADFDIGSNYWNRSDANCVDFPDHDTEIALVSGTQYRLTFENLQGLDAPVGAKVVCRRIANSVHSEPDNLDAPKARSATIHRWVAVSVSDHLARFICLRWTKASGGQFEPTVLNFWDGANPDVCLTGDPSKQFTVDWGCHLPADLECIKDESVFTLSYNRNVHKYEVISSASAVLGDPQKTKVGVGPVTQDCDTENGKLCFKQKQVDAYVFSCDDLTADSGNPENDPVQPTDLFCLDSSLFDCLELCDWICKVCEPYATEDGYCENCCGDCQFAEGAITGLNATIAGVPYSQTADPSTMTSECNHLVQVSGGAGNETWTVIYNGDGTWSVNVDGAVFLNGDGGCDTTVSVADPVTPTNTGSFSATGTECTGGGDPQCSACPETATDTVELIVPAVSEAPVPNCGDCARLGGTFTLEWDGGTWAVNPPIGACGGQYSWSLTCSPTDPLNPTYTLTDLGATDKSWTNTCDDGTAASDIPGYIALEYVGGENPNNSCTTENKVHIRIIKPAVQAVRQGVGYWFRRINGAMITGCGCQINDAVFMMNRDKEYRDNNRDKIIKSLQKAFKKSKVESVAGMSDAAIGQLIDEAEAYAAKQ